MHRVLFEFYRVSWFIIFIPTILGVSDHRSHFGRVRTKTCHHIVSCKSPSIHWRLFLTCAMDDRAVMLSCTLFTCHNLIHKLLQFGLALSYWLWSVSSTFLMFVIARIIGGVSKGNLNVSMAAMTDISSTEKRASGMVSIRLQFAVELQSCVYNFVMSVSRQWSE